MSRGQQQASQSLVNKMLNPHHTAVPLFANIRLDCFQGYDFRIGVKNRAYDAGASQRVSAFSQSN
jgi:hypothetical protein